jgi:hypothetical protein
VPGNVDVTVSMAGWQFADFAHNSLGYVVKVRWFLPV